ncbi:venom dipeptidyl peptidase 4-like [Diprion similis]|uniref:venom dipeptidyl peptidase 4-like n=1 Tax=Diprion similis TaxID=362088 RepID=UPI001EF9623D|nr:venom dipeptidyl peptidase 4-like [Diprion similis]
MAYAETLGRDFFTTAQLITFFQCLLGILIGLIGLGAARTSNDPVKVKVNGKEKLIPVTLEDIYSGYYSGKSFNGTWISGNEIVYRDIGTRDILIYNVEELTKTILINASVLSDWNPTSYSLSADNAYVLIDHSPVARSSYSTYKKFVVYEIATGNYVELADGELLSHAEWSPVGNSLVFVLDNDVYYREISGHNVTERRLTFDGAEDAIYNGISDWTYEGQDTNAYSAIYFSPDGTRLAVITFDDTDVGEEEYLYYGAPGDLEYQYSQKFSIRYPKPGTTNPTIALNVIDLNDTSASWVKLSAPEDVVGKEPIAPSVYWMSEELVIGTWTNRVQNVSQLVLYNASNGEGSNLHRIEESEGWVEVPTIIDEGGSLFLLKRQDSGTPAGSYVHLTRFSLDDGVLSNETDLTPGSQSVISLIGIDSYEEKVYFLATGDNAPSQKNLYAVSVGGSEPPTCISCEFETPEGNNCLYATASFSYDFSHYALTCSGPDPVTVRIYNSSHEQVLSWDDNEVLRASISHVLKPIIKDFYVTVNGYDAKVRLRLPPQFNESDTHTKYPMLVETYAGPDTVKITEDSLYDFGNYMTTNRGVIYAEIDGRGTAYKGSKMLFEVYRHLGSAEVEDQIAVTKVLQKTYGWIDANRTAMWGWSYGGYTSTMVLATDIDSVFKCAIAVAPVSSWIYSNSVYVEKYMGLPTEDDNLAGYNASDATRLVEGIRGKEFMLVHGTADDNVLYQQALALSNALVVADIQFRQVSYTNEAHDLDGVSSHLYHTIDNFLGDCLDLEDLY